MFQYEEKIHLNSIVEQAGHVNFLQAISRGSNVEK